MAMSSAWDLIKQTLSDWYADGALRMAAALSYYTALSLAPLLLVIVAVAGLVFGRQAVEGQLVDQMRDLMGQQGAQLVQTVLQNAAEPRAGVVAMTVGLVTLLLGATGVFLELQDAMNMVWEVQPKSGQGIKTFLRHRLLSLAMVVGVGFLLLVSLVVSAVLTALGSYLTQWLPGRETMVYVVHFGVSLVVITLLFAMIYKFLPDAQVTWRDVWLGALVTALLFSVGKWLIGLYLGRAGVGSAYGAAGSLVVLLVWVYYSALILFLGAQFTQVWARRQGRPIQPKDYAQPRTKA